MKPPDLELFHPSKPGFRFRAGQVYRRKDLVEYFPSVDRDLGRFVATVLAEPDRFRGARIDLASDDPTPTRMAAVLSGALGRPVRLVTRDPADIASADMRAMFGFLARGGYTVVRATEWSGCQLESMHDEMPESARVHLCGRPVLEVVRG